MPEQPLISIITPTYNQGHFIGQTIESILGQTYPHLEYIIMDGGSTDDTLDVIRRYESDPRLTWVSERDKGMSDALNKGFARSTGQIMGWLNSDDVYLGQPLQEAVDYFQAHPQAQVLYRQVQFTDTEGQPNLDAPLLGSPFDFVETLSGLVSIGQPATLWRRELWQLVGQIRQDLSYVMDLDYWLRASRYGELHFLEGIRATYRQHADSKTVANDAKAWQERQHLAEELVAQVDIYPQVKQEWKRVQSNLAMGLAQAYYRSGQKGQARQAIRQALYHTPLRQRAIYIALLSLDYHLGVSLSDRVAQLWKRIKPTT